MVTGLLMSPGRYITSNGLVNQTDNNLLLQAISSKIVLFDEKYERNLKNLRD